MTEKELNIQYALGSLSDDMKYELARNLNTPIKILTKLSTDKDWHIRYWIAENPNASKKVLTILSTDEDWWVRYWVADNPNTPKKILTVLSKDKDSSVRSKVASNPKMQLLQSLLPVQRFFRLLKTSLTDFMKLVKF